MNRYDYNVFTCSESCPLLFLCYSIKIFIIDIQPLTKIIKKSYVKKIVSLKIFFNFTTENESKNINLKNFIMEVIKIVNYGKSGTYLYAAIIKIENKYFWTETVYCKNKEDKKKIDWHKQKIQKELNEFSLNKYQLK